MSNEGVEVQTQSEPGKTTSIKVDDLFRNIGNDGFQCLVCEEALPDRRYLIAHLATHTGTDLCQCEICGEYIFGTEEYTKHIQENHPKFHCDICQKTFSSRSVYDIHVGLHEHLEQSSPPKTESKNEFCNVCDIEISDLKKHMALHSIQGLQFALVPNSNTKLEQCLPESAIDMTRFGDMAEIRTVPIETSPPRNTYLYRPELIRTNEIPTSTTEPVHNSFVRTNELNERIKPASAQEVYAFHDSPETRDVLRSENSNSAFQEPVKHEGNQRKDSDLDILKQNHTGDKYILRKMLISSIVESSNKYAKMKSETFVNQRSGVTSNSLRDEVQAESQMPLEITRPEERSTIDSSQIQILGADERAGTDVDALRMRVSADQGIDRNSDRLPEPKPKQTEEQIFTSSIPNASLITRVETRNPEGETVVTGSNDLLKQEIIYIADTDPRTNLPQIRYFVNARTGQVGNIGRDQLQYFNDKLYTVDTHGAVMTGEGLMFINAPKPERIETESRTISPRTDPGKEREDIFKSSIDGAIRTLDTHLEGEIEQTRGLAADDAGKEILRSDLPLLKDELGRNIVYQTNTVNETYQTRDGLVFSEPVHLRTSQLSLDVSKTIDGVVTIPTTIYNQSLVSRFNEESPENVETVKCAELPTSEPIAQIKTVYPKRTVIYSDVTSLGISSGTSQPLTLVSVAPMVSSNEGLSVREQVYEKSTVPTRDRFEETESAKPREYDDREAVSSASSAVVGTVTDAKTIVSAISATVTAENSYSPEIEEAPAPKRAKKSSGGSKRTRSETGYRTYKCTSCERHFACASALERHRQSKHPPHVVCHTCSICGKALYHPSHIYIHMRTHV